MAKQLAQNYSISGAVVTLTGVNISAKQLLFVADNTAGTILYGPGTSGVTVASGTNTTLTFGTSLASNSDVLTIYYDDGLSPALETGNLASIATNTNAGTAITGQTLATGSGLIGWLSNIYAKLAGSIAVTGTFWQTTQPVSGTVTTNAGTNTSTANLDVALSTRLKPADTLAAVTTVGSVTTLPAITGSVTSNDGGTKITSATIPAGGSGVTGWLSAIWYSLSQGIGVTIADGSAISLGSKADTQATDATSSWSVISLLKYIAAGIWGATPAGTNFIGHIGNQVSNGTSYSISALGATSSWTIPTGTNQLFINVGSGMTNYAFQAQLSFDSGTTWVNYPILQKQSVTGNGYNSQASGGNATISGFSSHAVDVSGMGGFLFRLNFVTLGSGSATVYVVPTSIPFYDIQNTMPLYVSASGSVAANNASSVQATYNFTGVIAVNTVVIGPTDCSQYRTVNIQVSALGTGWVGQCQVSNDGANWMAATAYSQLATAFYSFGNIYIGNGYVGSGAVFLPTQGAKYFRITTTTTQSAGTTTLTCQFSQQPVQTTQQNVQVINTPFTNDGGTKITAATMPTGGVGLTGWLSGIWYALTTGVAQDGIDGTSITAPTGGSGIRGWLSGIYSKLSGSIAVTGTFWQATQPVSGTVAVSGTIPVSAASALPVSGSVTSNPPAGSLTMSNSSVGTTSATLLAASSASKMLVVQNTHATQSLYVSTTTPATATNGILIPPTGGYEFPYIPTNALYCLGSGASTTYSLLYA